MSKQVRKTRYEKSLRIGVRFDGSNFVLLDCSPLPKLHKDSVCELVLRPEVIQNPKDRGQFILDEVIRILENGTAVLVGVSPHLIGDPKADGLIRDPQAVKLQTEYRFVEVLLQEDLYIRIRGDQKAKLEKCKCLIPALKREATSINHAFTLVSEAYETERLSHTGNVFDRAYTCVDPGGWRTLDDLRLKAITESRGMQKNTPPSTGG